MNPLSSFFQDLREKRLLPVALLLVLAAVAIPFVIGGGGTDSGAAADPVAVPVPGPADAARPAVELVGPASVRARPGKVRDPFRRAKAKPVSAPTSAPTAAPAPSTAKGGSVSGAGSTSSGTTSSAARTSTARASSSSKPAARRASAMSIAARSVYVTTAHLKAANHDYSHPLELLDFFGNRANPALQYVGVAAGGEYAIFLLGPAATASGDAGACVVADPCRAIALRKGEKLEVAVAFAGAPTRHYVLRVTGLRRVTKATLAAARSYRRHSDRAGRSVLKAISADAATAAALRQLRYSPRSGTVALIRAS